MGNSQSSVRTIELLFFDGCPHTEEARANLRAALLELGMAPTWIEWERGDADAPEYARRYGSPTVLVGGKDVSGGKPGTDAPRCRAEGSPTCEEIVRALGAAE